MKTNLILRSFFLLLLAGIITYSLSPVFSFSVSEEKPGSTEEFTAFLDKEIPRLMEAYEIPGVIIGMLSDGKTIWSNAYGFADVKTGRKMTTETYCRMESISKSVTAWGVMKLVEEGKIHLDTPVTRYISTWNFPESLYNENLITPRLLLSQSAGMPLGTIGVRYAPTETKPGLREILSKDAILKEEPGKEFSYSNTGFILLELLIEEVTKMDFAAYMEKEILLPLGMENSSYEWNPSFSPPVPNGYDANGNPIPVYVYPDKAAGGLFSTLDDMINFVTAGFFEGTSQSVLSAESIQTLYAPHVEIPGLYGVAFEQYGLGHFVDQLPDGRSAISHGGQGTGWMTQFYTVPATGDALIIFSNSQRSWPFFGAVLNDWGEYGGYGTIGMGKLVIASEAIWFLFGMFLFLLLWNAWGIIEDFLQQKRIFAPLSPNSRLDRAFYLLVLLGLSGVLIYASMVDYFEPASLFPVAVEWLGNLSMLYLLVLLVLIMFPVKQKKIRKIPNRKLFKVTKKKS